MRRISHAAAEYQENLQKDVQQLPHLAFSNSQSPYLSLFANVSIETTSWCNFNCAFCPSSLLNREHFFMSDQAFKKIIDELVMISYSGTIKVCRSNEPLTDIKLYEKIEYLKSQLPNVIVGFYTNGLCLTEELLKTFYKAGCNFIYIEAYHSKEEYEKLVILCQNIIQQTNKNDISL